MITSEKRVQEMLSSAEGQQKFLDWIGDEFTQLLLSAARERARPWVANGESSDLSLGRSIGAHDILDFLAYPLSGQEKSRKLDDLMPLYGSEEILRTAAAAASLA